MRVAFLVDGFNLYHSLDAACRALSGQSTKWLDLVSLCRELLPQIHHSARLESIHFFSAPPDHMEQARPGALDRHRAYIAAVLVSADSDMAPALREAARSFANRPIYCGFPFGRGSKELRTLARQCFRIRKERYAGHQLPETLTLADGSQIRRPASW
ncbi:MAG: NYN domain-containing protein [Candidatus Eisenbacteria bacterium]|nr:NYN domain-containing protein [Candidatus Eisenbacteria bacterium]